MTDVKSTSPEAIPGALGTEKMWLFRRHRRIFSRNGPGEDCTPPRHEAFPDKLLPSRRPVDADVGVVSWCCCAEPSGPLLASDFSANPEG